MKEGDLIITRIGDPNLVGLIVKVEGSKALVDLSTLDLPVWLYYNELEVING